MKYARGGMTSLDYLMEIQRLENELKKYEWISVKDKLPEIGKIIVIYSERTEYILGRFICEEEFIVEDGCPMSIAYLLGVQAYWTYLPEPPKE